MLRSHHRNYSCREVFFFFYLLLSCFSISSPLRFFRQQLMIFAPSVTAPEHNTNTHIFTQTQGDTQLLAQTHSSLMASFIFSPDPPLPHLPTRPWTCQRCDTLLLFCSVFMWGAALRNKFRFKFYYSHKLHLNGVLALVSMNKDGRATTSAVSQCQ